jgi:hypothetical protein
MLESSLQHAQTIQLTGNPLDLAFIPGPGQPSGLVVAMDPRPSGDQDTVCGSLASFRWDDGIWKHQTEFSFQDVNTAEPVLPLVELDKLLYTTESLRKTEFEDAPSEGGDSVVPSAMDTPA